MVNVDKRKSYVEALDHFYREVGLYSNHIDWWIQRGWPTRTARIWGDYHYSKLRGRAIELMEMPMSNVLDLGCGQGFMLRNVLHKFGQHINMAIGLDISKEHLYEGRMFQGEPQYQSIALILGDGARLPFKDNTFDIVVSIETFEHIPELEEALSEIWRVLKPGGRLIITTPNKYAIEWWRRRIAPFYKAGRILLPLRKMWLAKLRTRSEKQKKADSYTSMTFERMLDRAELRQYLDCSGFRIVRYELNHFFPEVVPYILPWWLLKPVFALSDCLEWLSKRLFAGKHCIGQVVVCTKATSSMKGQVG